MIPTNFQPSITGSAPTFLSAIIWMASNTVALEAIDQTAEPLCAKIALTEPAISIGLSGLCSDLRKDSKQNMPPLKNSTKPAMAETASAR